MKHCPECNVEYIDTAVRCSDCDVEQKFVDAIQVYIYENVRTDRNFVPADFAWTPPKGSIDGTKIKKAGPKLLQAGDIAPDFVLTLASGKSLTLGQALRGKKALLVNFWFIGCNACLSEMPEIADLYRTVNDLQVVAINDVDTTDEVRRFLQKPNYQFPVAIDEGAKTAEEYRVKDKGHPISYLIRPDRTIAYVKDGYDTERKYEYLKLPSRPETRSPKESLMKIEICSYPITASIWKNTTTGGIPDRLECRL